MENLKKFLWKFKISQFEFSILNKVCFYKICSFCKMYKHKFSKYDRLWIENDYLFSNWIIVHNLEGFENIFLLILVH